MLDGVVVLYKDYRERFKGPCLIRKFVHVIVVQPMSAVDGDSLMMMNVVQISLCIMSRL